MPTAADLLAGWLSAYRSVVVHMSVLPYRLLQPATRVHQRDSWRGGVADQLFGALTCHAPQHCISTRADSRKYSPPGWYAMDLMCLIIHT